MPITLGNTSIASSSGNLQVGGTGSLILPSGTTAQRPASPSAGMIRANTTINSYEIYDGTSWKVLNFSDPSNSYPIEYLVCAGGGGGGSDNSGGGGGGGVLTGTAFVQNGLYDIVVGAGGAGSPGGNIDSQTNGDNSSAFINWGQTALGGGFGSNGNIGHRPAGSGGSGGGAEGESSDVTKNNGGAGTFGQGFAGGNAPAGSGYGGGGGGAGGVGNNSVADLAGNGGQGLLSAINGTARYYGSGGGGSGIATAGGTGGSFSGFGIGNGNTGVAAGTAGETNSGGGGGGGSGTGDAGGNGGSGIVIIRYLGSARATGGSITSSGGYTIHTFTSSGRFDT